MLIVNLPRVATYVALIGYVRGILQGFSRDRIFVSGRDPGFPGTVRRGFYSTGRYGTGLNHHGIEREILDGIEISRDCTGRD